VYLQIFLHSKQDITRLGGKQNLIFNKPPYFWSRVRQININTKILFTEHETDTYIATECHSFTGKQKKIGVSNFNQTDTTISIFIEYQILLSS
jgi:hypothetical protein